MSSLPAMYRLLVSSFDECITTNVKLMPNVPITSVSQASPQLTFRLPSSSVVYLPSLQFYGSIKNNDSTVNIMTPFSSQSLIDRVQVSTTSGIQLYNHNYYGAYASMKDSMTSNHPVREELLGAGAIGIATGATRKFCVNGLRSGLFDYENIINPLWSTELSNLDITLTLVPANAACEALSGSTVPVTVQPTYVDEFYGAIDVLYFKSDLFNNYIRSLRANGSPIRYYFKSMIYNISQQYASGALDYSVNITSQSVDALWIYAKKVGWNQTQNGVIKPVITSAGFATSAGTQYNAIYNTGTFDVEIGSHKYFSTPIDGVERSAMLIDKYLRARPHLASGSYLQNVEDELVSTDPNTLSIMFDAWAKPIVADLASPRISNEVAFAGINTYESPITMTVRHNGGSVANLQLHVVAEITSYVEITSNDMVKVVQ